MAAAKIAKEEARADLPKRIAELDQVYEIFLKWLNCALEAADLARKEIKRSKVKTLVMG